MDIREKFLERANTFDREPANCGFGFVRPLSKGVKSRLEAFVSRSQAKPNAKDCSETRWIALKWGFVDESGEPILSEEDRKEFDTWDDSLIEPLFTQILEVSKVTDDDKEEFLKN